MNENAAKAFWREIEEALEDVATGRVELIPHDQVKRELAARRAQGRRPVESPPPAQPDARR